MTRTRSRWRDWKLWLALLLVAPPLFWALVLVLVPTRWARERVVQELSKHTGRPVELDRLRLGPLGGVHLNGLRIGQNDSKETPWLQVRELSLDLNLAQLLSGEFFPGEVSVQGADVRIVRRPDGTLEIADLLCRSPHDPARPDSNSSSDESRPVNVRLEDSSITVVDGPSGTTLHLTELQGDGVWTSRRVEIRELTGGLNGGHFEFDALLERGIEAPMFEGQLRAREIRLGQQGIPALDYLAPALVGASHGLDAKADLSLYLRGEGGTRARVSRSLVGQGHLEIDPIAFDGSKLLAELGQLVRLPEGGQRVGSLSGNFAIARGRVETRDLTLKVGGFPILMAGWTDSAGRFDYRIRAEGLGQRLAPEARELLADLPLPLDEILRVEMAGTPDRMQVLVDGVPLNDIPNSGTRRDRIKSLGQKLRERLFR